MQNFYLEREKARLKQCFVKKEKKKERKKEKENG